MYTALWESFENQIFQYSGYKDLAFLSSAVQDPGSANACGIH